MLCVLCNAFYGFAEYTFLSLRFTILRREDQTLNVRSQSFMLRINSFPSLSQLQDRESTVDAACINLHYFMNNKIKKQL